MPDAPDTAVTAAVHAFPFDIPADYTAVADGDLRTLLGQIRDHATPFRALGAHEHTEASVAALRACRDTATAVNGVLATRTALAAEVAEFGSELDDATAAADTTEDQDDEDEDEVDDVAAADVDQADDAPATDPAPAVTAAARRPVPRVRDVARGSRTPRLPSDAERRTHASMTAAAAAPGYAAGQTLATFADAGKVLSSLVDRNPALTAGKAARTAKNRNNKPVRPITSYDKTGRRLTLESFTRQSGVEIRRDFPDDLKVSDGGHDGEKVAQHAASQRRLPGGSLIRSAQAAVKAGRALTAAAGWCAPSETIYELLELETLDGMLDLPELQTPRGGWSIPRDGGPDFGSIWDAIGSSGDTHLTEAEVQASTLKVCTEIPCPDFDEVRLGVDYFCLTGSLLQRRGYPEIVERFFRGATVAMAHKINRGAIADIVAASGAATVIPANPNGDDAASAFLAAVELAIEDAKARHRMGESETVEAVLPRWVLTLMRAALSRRAGLGMLGVTDAEILDWFTIRRAVPRFVRDWQDAFSGLATGPGGSTPLAALPDTAQFVVYPAGTWVKAVQDVVALDTIYDSTLLETNQYTAAFVEDGWAMLQMGPLSRLYTVPVDASGVVGCCPTEGITSI